MKILKLTYLEDFDPKSLRMKGDSSSTPAARKRHNLEAYLSRFRYAARKAAARGIKYAQGYSESEAIATERQLSGPSNGSRSCNAPNSDRSVMDTQFHSALTSHELGQDGSETPAQ